MNAASELPGTVKSTVSCCHVSAPLSTADAAADVRVALQRLIVEAERLAAAPNPVADFGALDPVKAELSAVCLRHLTSS